MVSVVGGRVGFKGFWRPGTLYASGWNGWQSKEICEQTLPLSYCVRCGEHIHHDVRGRGARAGH